MAYDKRTWVNVDDPSKFTSDELNSFPRFDATNMNRIEEGIDAHIKDASVHNNATDGGGAIGEGSTETAGGAAVGKNATTTSGAAIGKNATSTFGAAIGDGASSQNGGGAVGYHASIDSGGGAVGREALATSGGAIGYNAKTSTGAAVGSLSSSDSGGAVGQKANATGGGAIGYNASAGSGGAVGYWSIATTGAAVGQGTKTSSGVALGYGAQAADSSGNGIDAIQLGSGANLDPKTLQVYSYTLMNEDGTIPVERLVNGLKIKTGTYTGNGKSGSGEASGSVSIPCERQPKMIIITRGTHGTDEASFAIGIVSENPSQFICVGCDDEATSGSVLTANIHSFIIAYDGVSLNWSTKGYTLDLYMNQAGRDYNYALLY